ncbi:MAG: DNA cytosine methyltransferase [Candidatus Peribacteria bacterium]|nr:DNA cytosine methyltransferase [Candidatus Peribacteria bacterium]
MPDAKCIGYSEIDKFAIKTYQAHFPDHQNYGDIKNWREWKLGKFDLLVG